MPEMELHWTTPEGRFVWLQIFGYRGWPQNETRRRAQVASYLADGIGQLDQWRQIVTEQRSEAPALDVDRGAWSSAFEEFGGFSALRPLLSISAVPPEPFPWAELETVGRVLLTVRSIEVHHRELLGGGSINKAMFLIERAHCSYGLLKNATYIKTAWRKYKNISHLASSWVLIDNAQVEPDLKGLRIFLTIAKDFEQFGISFRPHAAIRSCLMTEKYGRSQGPYRQS